MEISQLNEEKEAIDKLKRSANYFVMPIYETTIILNLIEKQQKEIENLKEINKEHQKLNGELEEENTRQHELLGNIHQNYRDKITKIQEQDKEIVDTQYISKDKIRDKIEELDNQQKQWLEDRKIKNSDGEIIFARDILKELLKEE